MHTQSCGQPQNLYVSAKRFISSSEVEKQLKEAIGELQRNKDDIMGVYTCFYDIQTIHVIIWFVLLYSKFWLLHYNEEELI